MKFILSFVFCFFLLSADIFGQKTLSELIEQNSKNIETKVIAWRRDFHQNPELGNEEKRTASIVAKHLRALGIEVIENVAFTGVIGILKGDKPGPVIALRADMDALPVTERGDLPFKSLASTQYNNQKTGVMHACGHDSHVAILMGTAEILAGMKKELAGTVKFIFQPAEEGVLDKTKPYGADGMIKAGCLENPKVDVIFGLHIESKTPAGTISYRSGSLMAAVDEFEIKVKGKQTHGAYPWNGVDPIVAASQIVLGLQTIVSRSVNLTQAPAVVTVGAINGGIRYNIIPEEVKLIGTIRTLDKKHRELVFKRIVEITEGIAQSAGCIAAVELMTMYPVTVNDPVLTEKMTASLQKSAGPGNARIVNPVMGAEDFSFYQEKVPGLFFNLGGRDPKKNPEEVSAHHTPDFYLDESGFSLGVKTFCNLVFDYAQLNQAPVIEAPMSKKKSKKNN